MLKLLKLVRLLRKVDGLAFRERAKIKVKLCGKPGYSKVTSENGQVVEEYYLVLIFYRSRRPYDPVRKAIHEVRHRVQHNHPEIHLFTVENMPDELRAYLRPETVKKLTPREIDAQIFDELAYSVFSANDTDSFLQLLFHGTKS